jgi:hypothetical protein
MTLTTTTAHVDTVESIDHSATSGKYVILYCNQSEESLTRYASTKRVAIAYCTALVADMRTSDPVHAEWVTAYATAANDELGEQIYPSATQLSRIAQGQSVRVTRETVEAERVAAVVSTVSPTVGILAALDQAYAAIRTANPDVPSAIALTIAPSRKARGHFQAGSWEDTGKLGTRHELNIGAERLQDGALATFATLLHECAHALAQATGQKDTSRQGRFHNGTFATIASAMGCVVTADDKIGHATGDTLQSWALDLYADAIAGIDNALSTFKPRGADKAKAAKTTLRVACDCGEAVTVPIKWYENFGVDSLSCAICESGYMPIG